MRIAELRRSIRTFQALRDEGMVFPEPEACPNLNRTSGSAERVLSQKRLKRQSPAFQLFALDNNPYLHKKGQEAQKLVWGALGVR